MILVFSEKEDESTNHVIDWLIFYNKDFKRFNDVKIHITTSESKLFIALSDEKLMIDSISSIWYRRGGNLFYDLIKTEHSEFDNIVNEERKKIAQYIYFKLSQKREINKLYQGNTINRLIVLEIAKRIGLEVPSFFLIDNKSDIEKLFNNRRLITKTIAGSAMVRGASQNELGVIYTNEVTRQNIKEFNSISYFEEKIEKKYELRIFYLDGTFFSMAIFSQRDEKTSQDFRKYNHENPNRTIPYQLPKKVEKKLDSLMREIKVNCGSIDMIVSKENDFYFLEVNPVGQFGMVSFPCNYHLEQTIADYLSYEEIE